jgi:hypothetical protein
MEMVCYNVTNKSVQATSQSQVKQGCKVQMASQILMFPHIPIPTTNERHSHLSEVSVPQTAFCKPRGSAK